MTKATLLTTLALAGLTSSAFAAEAAAPAAKTYGPFFKPVAIEDRRALSVDRSNFTYSASGINSGVVQLETSLIEYIHDEKLTGTDRKYTQFTFGNATIRAGLTDNWELKAGVASHVTARLTDATGAVTQQDGLGDTILESRYTFQGNNGEAVGVALMPYLKLPSNTMDGFAGAFNDKIEFGAQVPVTFIVNDKIAICTAPGFDVNYNGQPSNRYDLNPFFATAFWYTVSPELALFNEWYVKKNTGAGKDDWNSYVGFGGVYYVSSNVGIDFGVNIGLAEVAADVSTRVGLTVRF